MATFSLPDDKGRINQVNSGDTVGNVYATFGMDFDTKGKIKVSKPTKVFFDGVTTADLDEKIGAFVAYDDTGISGQQILGFGSGDAFSFTIDSYGSVTTNTGDGFTNSSDGTATFFDGLVLVARTTSIYSTTDNSTYTDWWGTTLGQAALASSSTDEPRLMKVGATGYLYISDDATKIYYVTPTGTVAKTGGGTLDFSATNYRFTCMESTSQRMWIGTKNIGGEAVILEWDMSVNATTVNRIHNIGAEKVQAIIIHEDNPIAILNNGKVKIFNGVTFVDMPNVEIRLPKGYKLASNFMHRNGWDIVDGLPHLAISGLVEGTDSKYLRASRNQWAMPAGVYCLDPEKGLYHRYSFGSGDVTRTDYGQCAVTDVGALVAVNGTKNKFLVSYETMLTDSTYNAVVAYDNEEDTVNAKGWLATTFALSLREMWKMVELFHKPLETGCKIKIYSRPENTDGVLLTGAWATTDTFNAVTTGTGLTKGDLALIKMGNGAGQWVRVDSVSESSTVTSIVLEETNSFVTAGDKGTLEVFDFKFMGTIDDTTRDYHEFNVPTDKKRKRQFLFEFTQPAGTEIDLDYIIANT